MYAHTQKTESTMKIMNVFNISRCFLLLILHFYLSIIFFIYFTSLWFPSSFPLVPLQLPSTPPLSQFKKGQAFAYTTIREALGWPRVPETLRLGIFAVCGRCISFWFYLPSSDHEMEPQLENVRLTWLSVWFSADAGKTEFLFVFLTPLEKCELVLGAKANKHEEDLYHIQPQKDGNYKRQKKWLWHAS